MTRFSRKTDGSSPPARVTPKRPTAAGVDATASAHGEDGLIARLVTSPYWPIAHSTDSAALIDTLGHLSGRPKIRFLVTPAGFLTFKWPSGWEGPLGWQEQPADVSVLLAAADAVVEATVTPEVRAAAIGKVDYLVAGIDGHSDSEGCAPGDAHAEFVYVYDLAAGRIEHRTGKSFPTSAQEHALVHFFPITSHVRRVGDERVLLLACHDLAVYSPRGAGATKNHPRSDRRAAMRAMIQGADPTVILHLAHAFDTGGTWNQAWNRLRSEDAPHVKAWASGVNFAHYDPTTGALIDPRKGTRDDPWPVLVGSSSPHNPSLDILIGCQE